MQRPFEDLLRDLESPNRQNRCRAARELGEGRDTRAVGPLLQALNDPAADVRAKAAAALGRLRDPEVIAPLIQVMCDDKVSVRTAAAAAVKKFGKRAYQPLLDAYKGASGDFRATLLTVLAQYKTPAVSELLIAALEDQDKGLGLQAVRFLGRRKDQRAVEPLLTDLASAKAVLGRAARAWEEGDSPQSGGQLRPEWAEWAEIVPRLQSVISALGEIGDARAFAPLQELLEMGECRIHAGIVPDVVKALRSIDNARAVDLIHGMLDDQSNPGKDWLAMTLAGMDLMSAAQSLRVPAKGGDIGVLWQALQAAGAAHKQFFSPRPETENAEETAGEMSRNSTEMLRQLEWTLRSLARGQGEA